tara:strand:- start:2688 stop:2855 length:168 start_codon:yes stop_codon:yes gene_type:complete
MLIYQNKHDIAKNNRTQRINLMFKKKKNSVNIIRIQKKSEIITKKAYNNDKKKSD